MPAQESKLIINHLDSFAVAIIDSFYQGDKDRLRKIFFQLPQVCQQVFTSIVDCWHSDPSQNPKAFNDLLDLSENNGSALSYIVLAEKALDLDDIKVHEDSILRAFSFLSRRGVNLEQRFLSFYEIVKIKGWIHSGSYDKAVAQLNSLVTNTNNDRFIEGLCFYLFGLAYKLKGKRCHYKARNYFNDAISIFDVHQPNRYLLNLTKLQLSLFVDTPASELSKIANEFTQLACPREASLALAQYNYLTKFSKNGFIAHDVKNNYERVGNYYFISESMKDALKLLSIIALGEDGHIMIFGEEGTGKEVFANVIHKFSNRADKPFTSINCAQLKNELFESEFFGYEKGSYTGAVNPKRGLLEDYNGGMIFLDEIAELTKENQGKLLTVLQQGKFRRIGSNKEIEVDIRFIGATNREIKKMIERDKLNREANDPNIKETFRSDLASRFPWRINVPPLSNRKDEIVYLAEIFLTELAKDSQFILDDSAKNYLLNRDYPSNVRSLKDFLRCAITYAKQNNIILITSEILNTAEIFVSMENANADKQTQTNLSFDQQVAQFASNLLSNTLLQCRNNAKLAAQKLDMPLRTFYKRLETYNLKFPKPAF